MPVYPTTSVYISCHIGSHKMKGTDSGIYHVPRHLSKLWLISPTCNISHITLIGQSYTQFVVRFHRSKTATITSCYGSLSFILWLSIVTSQVTCRSVCYTGYTFSSFDSALGLCSSGAIFIPQVLSKGITRIVDTTNTIKCIQTFHKV